MKIIREGRDPKTIPMLASCNHCKTQVEFLPIEAKYVSNQREGDYYQVDCPVCNHQITASATRYNGPE